MIAGFTLLFDRPFQVGDRGSYGDVYGEIKSIYLRGMKVLKAHQIDRPGFALAMAAQPS